MVTTPNRGHVAAAKRLGHFQRTIATELPQELSRLPAQFGFAEAPPSAAHGSRSKLARHPKKKRKGKDLAISGLMDDDSHPTILAASRGLSDPR